MYEEPFCLKLYSFYCLVPVPLKIEEYQRKEGIEPKQDPVGPSWIQKPTPPFLVYRKHGFSLLGLPPSSKEQAQLVNDEDSRLIGILGMYITI